MIFLLLIGADAFAGSGIYPARSILVRHVNAYYQEQLTNPQKKIRKSMAQFGYNLSYFAIPLFPITGFINHDDFGIHSYSKPDRKEKNGCLYTCKGGFIDFSHLRAAADWTVYLAFSMLNDQADQELPPESGTLKLQFTNIDKLDVQDIVDMAQKIAFERLTWHEVASWHYHPPYHLRTDQQSAFTPEDTYSNFLGTVIGRKIAMRILLHLDTRPFEEIATEEIEKAILSLEPVSGKAESKLAYDLVDRHKQIKLPEDKRNNDVWWDSKILFRDQRYVFKRDLDLGPELVPWLVPQSDRLGCPAKQDPELLKVPFFTQAGIPLDRYYTFTITPDTAMFYGRRGQLVHQPFPAFATRNLDEVVAVIAAQMESILLAGFDRRDCCDPVLYFKDLRRVGLSIVTAGWHR